MSYTPTNWQTGDVVTSEKLNKLENGVASALGREFVEISYEITQRDEYDYPLTGELQASYNDLKALLQAGKMPFVKEVFAPSGGDAQFGLTYVFISYVQCAGTTYSASTTTIGVEDYGFAFNADDPDVNMTIGIQ